MSTARKILSNTTAQFLGRLITALLSIITLKLVTNYLGKQGYGEYTTIYEFIGFFAIFADMGIYTIAVHELSKDKEKAPYVIGNIMGLRTVSSVLALLAAICFAFILPQYQGGHIPFGVCIVSLTTFLNLLYGTITSILQVHYKMHYAALALIFGKILTLIYMFLAVIYLAPLGAEPYLSGVIIKYGIPNIYADNFDMGFYHLLIAGVIGTAGMYFMTSAIAKRYISFKYRFDTDFWKRVIFKAAPGGVALIFNNLYFRVDVVLLSLILPMEKSLVGIYGVAIRILDILLVIPVFFMNSTLPVLTKYYQENKERMYHIIQMSFDFLIITGLPIIVGGLTLSKGIILFVSSEEFVTHAENGFYGSDMIVNILLFALFFSFLNFLFGFLLIVDKKPLKFLKITVSAVIINIIGTVIMIQFYKHIGAAAVSVLSQFIILVCAYIVSKKELRFSLKMKTFGKILISALVMFAAIYSVLNTIPHKYAWILAGVVGMIVYGVCLLISGVITKETVKMFRK